MTSLETACHKDANNITKISQNKVGHNVNNIIP
jgi:hypothetical protein